MNLPSHLTNGPGSNRINVFASRSKALRHGRTKSSQSRASLPSGNDGTHAATSDPKKGKARQLAQDTRGQDGGALDPEQSLFHFGDVAGLSSRASQSSTPGGEHLPLAAVRQMDAGHDVSPSSNHKMPSSQRPGGYDASVSSKSDGDDDAYKDNRCARASRKVATVLRRHLAFVGPGIVASVAYTDPGNWVTDLAAGSQFGYALLFIVLLSGLFGIFLQILAVRMGVVTGYDLARNTRMLLLPDEENKAQAHRNGMASSGAHGAADRRPIRFRTARRITLWGLYGVSECAIIATELAELIGSAIALNLLFPALPLYAGVLVTSVDVLLILLVYRPNGNFRIFEVLIGTLVLIVMACYVALIVRTKPHWPTVFRGYVPSSTIVEPQALYTGVGIIGAVIMPHALYLGSHFSTINRTSRTNTMSSLDYVEELNGRHGHASEKKNWYAALRSLRDRIRARFPGLDAHTTSQSENRNHSLDDSPSPQSPHLPAHLQTTPRLSSSHTLHNRMSIAEMRTHLPHAAWDIGLSLFFLAITVNSAILIVAAAAFHYGSGPRDADVGDLYDAFDLLHQTLGHAYAILFAIALLAAGQAASITCTLAGQIVSEGFIDWRTNPFVRRAVTRGVTIVPSLAIAIAVGRDGLDEALVASQVVLALALPFVMVPLALVTSKRARMHIVEEADEEAADEDREQHKAERQSADGTAPGMPSGINDSACARQSLHKAQGGQAGATADEIAPASPLPDVSSPGVSASRPEASSQAQDDKVRPAAAAAAAAAAPSFRCRTLSHDFTNGRIAKTSAGVIFAVIVVADVYTLVTTFQGKQ